jgi:hypothetical protein
MENTLDKMENVCYNISTVKETTTNTNNTKGKVITYDET